MYLGVAQQTSVEQNRSMLKFSKTQKKIDNDNEDKTTTKMGVAKTKKHQVFGRRTQNAKTVLQLL